MMFGLSPYSRRNSMASYNPFRELDEMERAFFGGSGLTEFKTDIRESGNDFVLEADLPGFDKKDIHVDINGSEMTISAQRKAEKEEKREQDGYVYRERSFGSFTRSFDVSGIDTDGIKGDYKDGVLTLTLPKRGEDTPQARRLELGD